MTDKVSETEWRAYESIAAEVCARISGAQPRKQMSLKDRNGQERLVDLYFEVANGFEGNTIKYAAECKRYAHQLDLADADCITGMYRDLPVDRVLIFAHKGVSKSAATKFGGIHHPTFICLPYPADVAAYKAWGDDIIKALHALDIIKNAEGPTDQDFAKIRLAITINPLLAYAFFENNTNHYWFSMILEAGLLPTWLSPNGPVPHIPLLNYISSLSETHPAVILNTAESIEAPDDWTMTRLMVTSQQSEPEIFTHFVEIASNWTFPQTNDYTFLPHFLGKCVALNLREQSIAVLQAMLTPYLNDDSANWYRHEYVVKQLAKSTILAVAQRHPQDALQAVEALFFHTVEHTSVESKRFILENFDFTDRVFHEAPLVTVGNAWVQVIASLSDSARGEYLRSKVQTSANVEGYKVFLTCLARYDTHLVSEALEVALVSPFFSASLCSIEAEQLVRKHGSQLSKDLIQQAFAIASQHSKSAHAGADKPLVLSSLLKVLKGEAVTADNQLTSLSTPLFLSEVPPDALKFPNLSADEIVRYCSEFKETGTWIERKTRSGVARKLEAEVERRPSDFIRSPNVRSLFLYPEYASALLRALSRSSELSASDVSDIQVVIDLALEALNSSDLEMSLESRGDVARELLQTMISLAHLSCSELPRLENLLHCSNSLVEHPDFGTWLFADEDENRFHEFSLAACYARLSCCLCLYIIGQLDKLRNLAESVEFSCESLVDSCLALVDKLCSIPSRHVKRVMGFYFSAFLHLRQTWATERISSFFPDVEEDFQSAWVGYASCFRRSELSMNQLHKHYERAIQWDRNEQVEDFVSKSLAFDFVYMWLDQRLLASSKASRSRFWKSVSSRTAQAAIWAMLELHHREPKRVTWDLALSFWREYRTMRSKKKRATDEIVLAFWLESVPELADLDELDDFLQAAFFEGNWNWTAVNLFCHRFCGKYPNMLLQLLERRFKAEGYLWLVQDELKEVLQACRLAGDDSTEQHLRNLREALVLRGYTDFRHLLSS